MDSSLEKFALRRSKEGNVRIKDYHYIRDSLGLGLVNDEFIVAC